MGAASTSSGTTSFAAPTITPGLVNATTTATSAMPTTTMAAAGSGHLPPAPGASERAHRRLLPRLLQDHGDHPVVQLVQHSEVQRPQRTRRAHDHGRGPVHAKRSCTTEVSSGENGGHRGVSTQSPAKQDHRWRHVVHQDVRETRRPVFLVDHWDPSTWGPSSTSGANFAAHPISSTPTVETATLSSLASTTLHTAPATRRRQTLHQGACTFSLGGIHSSACIFCDSKMTLLLPGKGSYSSRSKHLAIRFMLFRDWIVDEKLVIDHVSIKDQLSVVYLLRNYFLDAPAKISTFLAFFLFFPPFK